MNASKTVWNHKIIYSKFAKYVQITCAGSGSQVEGYPDMMYPDSLASSRGGVLMYDR